MGARKHRLSVLGSTVQPHLCPSALQIPRSKGSQAWPVAAAPRWLAGWAEVTAHLDPIIRPGLGAAAAASSVKQEARLGGERRGRESASATEAGRSTSRSSLPPGAIWALRVTLWETPSVDLWGRAAPFLHVLGARGRCSQREQMRGTREEWSAPGARTRSSCPRRRAERTGASLLGNPYAGGFRD